MFQDSSKVMEEEALLEMELQPIARTTRGAGDALNLVEARTDHQAYGNPCLFSTGKSEFS